MSNLSATKQTFEWAEIIKPIVEVVSGQTHNQQLIDTLKHLLQYQIATQSQISQEVAHSIAGFYQNQFVFYSQLIASKPKSIFSLFDKVEDPRALAWDDTQRFMLSCLQLQGDHPEARERRNVMVENLIENLTQLIQNNSFAKQDQAKLGRVLDFLKAKATP